MILSVLVPILSFAAAFAAHLALERKYGGKLKEDVKKFRIRLVGAACVLVCVLLFITALVYSNMIDGKSGLSAAALAAACLLTFSALLAARYIKSSKAAKLLKKGAVCALVLIAAEVILFNGKSFTHIKEVTDIPLDTVKLSQEAELTESKEIRIKSSSILEMPKLPDSTTVLEIGLDSKRTTDAFDVKLRMTDDNITSQAVTVQHKHPKGYDTTVSMSFRPYGKIRTLSLFIDRPNEDITVRSIKALSAPRYSFSAIRYFFLLVLCLVLIAIKEYRFYTVTYDRKKTAHIIAVGAMTLLVTFSGLLFSAPDQKLRNYPDIDDLCVDPFVATYDAFSKKQTYIDTEVDEKLAGMNDPYDNNYRGQNGISFMWDYAFYKGHYYCYFGAAPVLTYYAPFYKLKGSMPTMAMANNFFAVLGLLFMCTAILSVIRLLKLKANLLLLLLMMPTGAAAMGFWFAANCIDRYTLPCLAGLCFLMICLSAGMTAICTKKKIKQLILLFISGASLSLCVGSRPTISFCAVILIPYFIDIIRDKKQKKSSRAIQTACFLVPLMIGAVLIMMYNNARFDSPFQFGNIYQLTVSNAAANDLSLTYLPDAIGHYFIQLPRFRTSFPFIEAFPIDRDNYQKFFYISSGCGALSYPVLLWGMFMLPYALGRKAEKPADRRRRLVIWLCLAVSVITAWLDFSMGGIVTHYIFDMTPLLFIASMTGVFRSCENPCKNRSRYVLSGVVMAATMVFTFALCFDLVGSTLLTHYPHLLDKAEDLIIFWQ
ncbi:hypothetical protein [uncultured Ruminococcus sp.]|uniref:hypothetical protein n=1 Tax=uncultured Ruminococcus sp. TaxID=165186 RepID=UPI002631917B|nr:hypothetical protein [uncultured Ruminococcus sp.]